MTVINTNLLSQIAQNNLNSTQASLTSAITQLSSGKKINSAADDPAGLAIVSRLTAQINGQTTAQANANAGISLTQTGQSALSQITNNLQTIRQLAVQASNATYSAADRASLNQEVQQSLAQINTIAATTSFNGTSLLDGTFGTQNFQIGANAGQVIGVNLSQGAKASQIGQTYSSTLSLAGTSGLSTQALSVSVGGAPAVAIGTAVAGTSPGQDANSAYAAAQAINNANVAGLTAQASNSQTFNISTVQNTGASAANYNLTINGVSVFTASTGKSLSAGGTVQSGDLVNAINSVTSKTGVMATINPNGSLQLAATDGSNITVAQKGDAGLTGGLDNTAYTYNGAGGALNSTTYAGTMNGSTSGALLGTVTLSSSTNITLSGAAAVALNQASAANGNAATANLNAGTGSYTGNTVAATTFNTPFALSSNDLIVNGVAVTTTGASTVSSLSDVASLINNNAALSAQGVKATLTNNGTALSVSSTTTAISIAGAKASTIFGVTTGSSSFSGAAPTDLTSLTNLTAGQFAVNGVTLTGNGSSLANLAGLINGNATLAQQGITASVGSGSVGLIITNASGTPVSVTGTAAGQVTGDASTFISNASNASHAYATDLSKVSINGIQIAATAGSNATAADVAAAITGNAALKSIGITATSNNGALQIVNNNGGPVLLTGTGAPRLTGTDTTTLVGGVPVYATDLATVTINGTAITAAADTSALSASDVATKINANATLTAAGITASTSPTGQLQIFNASGAATAIAGVGSGPFLGGAVVTAAAVPTNVTSKLTSSNTVLISAALGAGSAGDYIAINGTQVDLSTLSGGASATTTSAAIAAKINASTAMQKAGITADGSSATLKVYSKAGGAVAITSGGADAAATFGTVGNTTIGTATQNSTSVGTSTSYGGPASLAAGDFTVNGVQITGAVASNAGLANLINSNAALSGAGITADVTSLGKLQIFNATGGSITTTGAQASAIEGATNFNAPVDAATYSGSAPTGTLPTSLAAGQLTINGMNVTAGSINTMQDVADAINNANITGVSAKSVNGALVVQNGGDNPINIGGTAASTILGTTSATTSANYSVGSGGSLQQIDVLSTADAQKAIQTVDAALNQISSMQGQLGAVQNRFSSTISNLTASTQNAQSTQSTTQDTDYAAAAAQLSRAQVLSQAATAMIAQANQLPQQVLKLLQ